MPKFYIVRLGKDSVSQIKAIDALHTKLSPPLQIEISCAQVPKDFAPDDFVFICLGSDNNEGTSTDWVKGLRAMGVLKARKGGKNYNDLQNLTFSLGIVFPQSVAHHDFLAKAPTAYFWFSDIPVLGLNTHSNQTVQQIKPEDSRQNVR